jgi:hypothetical protein
VVPWRSQQVWARHDDESLRPYSSSASIVMSAMQLVSPGRRADRDADLLDGGPQRPADRR